MESDDALFRSLAQTLHELTQLDVQWVGPDGLVKFEIAANRVPETLCLSLDDWSAAKGLVADGSFCSVSTAGRLEYVIAEMPRTKGLARGYLMVGPFRTVAPTLTEVHELMVGLEIPLIERVPITTLYEALPVVGSNFSRALGTALVALVQTAAEPVRQAFHQARRPKTAEPSRVPWTSDQLEIESRYRAEAALRHMVSTGNRALYEEFQAKTALALRMEDRIVNNPLRSSKNITFVLNSILRVAAEQGGLHPVYLHQISTRYANEIEACRTATEVNQLQSRMTLGYLDAVRQHHTAHLTAATKRLVDHIGLHLQDDLSASGVARALNLTPRGIANRFRRELATTLTIYVQDKRVAEARWLLESTALSIKEIAGLVGFSDPNHFSRVFRQRTGVTPREARQRNS